MKLQLVFVAKLYCCTKERAEFRFQFAVFRSECFLPLLSFVPLIQKRDIAFENAAFLLLAEAAQVFDKLVRFPARDDDLVIKKLYEWVTCYFRLLVFWMGLHMFWWFGWGFHDYYRRRTEEFGGALLSSDTEPMYFLTNRSARPINRVLACDRLPDACILVCLPGRFKSVDI